MPKKKYILFLLILMMFNAKSINAKTECYYIDAIGETRTTYNPIDDKIKITADEFNDIFAISLEEAPQYEFNQEEISGEDVDVNCNELFGEKGSGGIRDMVDEILEYPRVIVPILIIVFGSIDFAKAVIAGKEEDMKKAQRTFIKRLIIGVAFFFIPLIIDLLMDMADMVWEGLGYTTC